MPKRRQTRNTPKSAKPRGPSAKPRGQRTLSAKPRGQRALLRTYERLSRVRQPPRYVFTLYVTGASTHSLAAVRNLRALCARYLPGNSELNIVDILHNPTLAGAAQILASPTLVKSSPPPVQRFVGDLSDEARVLRALGIPKDAADRDAKQAD